MPAYSGPAGHTLGSPPQTAVVFHDGSRIEVAAEQPTALLDLQLPPIFLRPRCGILQSIAFHAANPTVLFSSRTQSYSLYRVGFWRCAPSVDYELEG
ncbi:hypothetical protein PTI98_008607 [Pleurotus ostreatus]|nr:hypothetical protein PTI98_008607 [Pleurotus ostreatus]